MVLYYWTNSTCSICRAYNICEGKKRLINDWMKHLLRSSKRKCVYKLSTFFYRNDKLDFVTNKQKMCTQFRIRNSTRSVHLHLLKKLYVLSFYKSSAWLTRNYKHLFIYFDILNLPYHGRSENILNKVFKMKSC